MDQTDRDRLLRMEIGIEAIKESIAGDQGLVHRMNRHSDRIQLIERSMMIGTGIFITAGSVVALGKDLFVAWVKKKMEGHQ